jgi:hypothetical protein
MHAMPPDIWLYVSAIGGTIAAWIVMKIMVRERARVTAG